MLSKDGWLPSLGFIAVAILVDVPTADVIEDNRRDVASVVFVDGYHRVIVLLEWEKKGKNGAHIVARIIALL